MWAPAARARTQLQRQLGSHARSLSTPGSQHYDVVVVGGGVVGAAAACKLAQLPSMKGSKILVVETFPPPPLTKALDPSRPIDVRTYAMTPASSQFLDSVGAWNPLVEAGRFSPYNAMQVWSESSNNTSENYIHFDAFNHGGPNNNGIKNPFLGTIVEHTSVQAALFEEMTRLHNEGLLELRCPAKVEKMEFDDMHKGSNMSAQSASLTLSMPNPNHNKDKNTDDHHIPSPAERAVAAGHGRGTIDKEGKGGGDERIVETIKARLVIAADGGQSPTRKAAGIGTWGWNYAQKAVICTVDVGPNGLASATSTSTSNDEDGVISIQRFLPTGPIALLPLWKTPKESNEKEASSSSTRFASLIWSTTPQHASYLTSLDEKDFIDEINHAFSSQSSFENNNKHEHKQNHHSKFSFDNPLKGIKKATNFLLNESIKAAQLTGEKTFINPSKVLHIKSKKFAIDLNFSQSSTYVKWRIALVGDAAHSIHPMAGQGLNMGIADASALVQAIDQTARAGLDIGDPQNFLGEYGTKRYNDNLIMGSSIDIIHRLFGYELGQKTGGPKTINDLPQSLQKIITLSRDFSLKSLNAFPPIKSFIVQFAMGK